jgi:hypothetical protein
MKTNILAVFILMTGLTVTAQTNLVKNGGFEQGDLKLSAKEAIEPTDWYSTINTKIFEGKISYTTDEFYKGKKSIKMSIPACTVKSRGDIYFAHNLDFKDKQNMTLNFYAKSANAIKLSVFIAGFQLKSGRPSAGNGKVVSLTGNNVWKKYTVKLNLMPNSTGTWDFSKNMAFAIGFNPQILESENVIYFDEMEVIETN